VVDKTYPRKAQGELLRNLIEKILHLWKQTMVSPTCQKVSFFATLGAMAKGKNPSFDGAITKLLLQMWLIILGGHLM
jgi:hypothetical protein